MKVGALTVATIVALCVDPAIADRPTLLGPPPKQAGLPAFYTKYLDYRGLPIVSSANVFDRALRHLFEQARAQGRFENTYAAENYMEYWAEGVQSWFDANLEAIPTNGVHNQVNTRGELAAYDPALAALVSGVFKATPRRWAPVRAQRLIR